MALVEWINNLPEDQEMLFCGLNRALDISPHIGAGQINRIYKKIARKAGLDETEIEGISSQWGQLRICSILGQACQLLCKEEDGQRQIR